MRAVGDLFPEAKYRFCPAHFPEISVPGKFLRKCENDEGFYQMRLRGSICAPSEFD
jgi:hypothetical protein